MKPTNDSESIDHHIPIPLGIAGFEYADLHDPTRFPDLLEAFDDAVRARDPERNRQKGPVRTETSSNGSA